VPAQESYHNLAYKTRAFFQAVTGLFMSKAGRATYAPRELRAEEVDRVAAAHPGSARKRKEKKRLRKQ